MAREWHFLDIPEEIASRVQDINIAVARQPERMLDVRRSSIDIVEQCRT
jgi:hypothetical protein